MPPCRWAGKRCLATPSADGRSRKTTSSRPCTGTLSSWWRHFRFTTYSDDITYRWLFANHFKRIFLFPVFVRFNPIHWHTLICFNYETKTPYDNYVYNGSFIHFTLLRSKPQSMSKVRCSCELDSVMSGDTSMYIVARLERRKLVCTCSTEERKIKRLRLTTCVHHFYRCFAGKHVINCSPEFIWDALTSILHR